MQRHWECQSASSVHVTYLVLCHHIDALHMCQAHMQHHVFHRKLTGHVLATRGAGFGSYEPAWGSGFSPVAAQALGPHSVCSTPRCGRAVADAVDSHQGDALGT